MANKALFNTTRGQHVANVDTVNEAGGKAYRFTDKHLLAQYAATGCLNDTFYAGAEAQLETILKACEKVEPSFIAKTALYCRERGYMKDMPALLTAMLTMKGNEYLPGVFNRVVGNGKMLRNFVQIVRSGVVGRKSLGTRPKKLVQQWLNTASEYQLLDAAIGTQPSLKDVLKMVHVHPEEEWRKEFFAWVIDKPFDIDKLPPLTRAFELFKADRSQEVPAVPFRYLTALPLTTEQWTSIALNSGWQMIRQNLNTFARHGVFEDHDVVVKLAKKLRDERAIEKSKVFPYQLLTAYKAANDLPWELSEALQDALELSLKNVPTINGKVVICPDVSGSMRNPVTGDRGSATTKVRCIDVAGLMTAALMRKNGSALVLPFEGHVVDVKLNARDSVMTNAEKLAAINGMSTNCSAPLAKMNQEGVKADLVIFVSDNESWIDSGRHRSTETMVQWNAFKQRNPNAKLVCIDMQPYGSTQAHERHDILNVGGFSDAVFDIISAFANNELNSDHFVGVIEQTEL